MYLILIAKQDLTCDFGISQPSSIIMWESPPAEQQLILNKAFEKVITVCAVQVMSMNNEIHIFV